MIARPYTTREVADLIGRSAEHVARAHRRLHETHNMPLPLAGRPYRWDRRTFDLWRADPRRPMAANDAQPGALDDDAARAALAQAYGRRSA